MEKNKYIELADRLLEISDEEQEVSAKRKVLEAELLELGQLDVGDIIRLNSEDKMYQIKDKSIICNYGITHIQYKASDVGIGLYRIIYDYELFDLYKNFEVLNKCEGKQIKVIRKADKTKFHNFSQLIKKFISNKYL